MPSLFEELKHRSPARMAAVSRRAVAVCFVCYAAIGLAGYTSTSPRQKKQTQVLAKHDENYMPPEVAAALEGKTAPQGQPVLP